MPPRLTQHTETQPDINRAEASLDEGLGTRAFVEAMGELGYTYDYKYNQGNRDVIAALQAEEANLFRARDLARAI